MSDRATYIASPFNLYKLDWFGVIGFDAFGYTPFLVGSALLRKDFRDVDVRILIPDNEFSIRFGDQSDWRLNVTLKAMNIAWSGFGHHLTGLPIDFQIEQQTKANEDPNSGRRQPLGLNLRMEGTAL